MTRFSEAASKRAGGAHGIIPWRAAGAVLVAVTALVGAGLVGAALSDTPVRPPQPAAEAAPTHLADGQSIRTGALTDSNRLTASPSPVGMPRSVPTIVTISKIGVNATIMPLGLNSDGTIQVPSLDQAQQAGWYQLGPSPGQVGNSVIVGHVDSYAMGPAVFFRLGELRPQDRIEVTRADGTVARFTVDGVKSYPKTNFPTDLVYGPSSKIGLRLVTCGGQFDDKQRSYIDNIVVFATAATT